MNITHYLTMGVTLILMLSCGDNRRDFEDYYEAEDLSLGLYEKIDGELRNGLYRKGMAIARVISFEFVVKSKTKEVGEELIFSVMSLVREENIDSYSPYLLLGDYKSTAIAKRVVKSYSKYRLLRVEFKIPNTFIFGKQALLIVDSNGESILVGDDIRNDLKNLIFSHSGKSDGSLLFWEIKLDQYTNPTFPGK